MHFEGDAVLEFELCWF